MTDIVIKRALLSVSDKAGLVELGHALAARHVELVSTAARQRRCARQG
jgi:phosphoribosylaminoimidazolecarboxamide formyltransferase / IMP cyclohydrolase